MDHSGDEGGGDDDGQPQQSTSSWRACDNCRARKIKCDKRSPCSNCRAANTICRTASRPKEQRQRILISDQYEKKIEIIEARLARIEVLLHNLASQPTTIPSRAPVVTLGPSYSPRQEAPSNTSVRPLPRTAVPDVKTNAPFEGDSSLRAHSVHASRVFENAMSKDTMARTPEMQDALLALRSLIEKQHALSVNQDWRFPNHQGDVSLDLSSVKMPAMNTVVSLLRLCKEAHNFLDLPFIDFDQFNDLCKRVYFATEDYSLAVFALVNGGLYYLFNEVAMLRGKDVPEARENVLICRANLEYAMGRFNIFTAPTTENLQALLLGASYAIDLSQPSLCWALTSTAARLCQTLGYHRSVVSPDDSKLDIELKKRMFWFTYILDKSLSLRLGHSSILQDFDITLGLPELSTDSQMGMWDTLYGHWVKIGYFQGRLYEELYSPRALSESETDRTRKGKAIIGEMQLWYQEVVQIDPSRAYNPQYYEAATISSETMYYSLMTLAYRAIPPGPSDSSAIFSNECILTARSALKAHQRNSDRYRGSNSWIWHGYISWILMNCPFAPFMVIFCHAVATADLTDLQCLGDFVSSLQSPGEVIEAADKLWRLCQVFHRVAELYIDAKLKQQQQHGQQEELHAAAEHKPQAFSPDTLGATTNLNTTLPSNTTASHSNHNRYALDDFEPYLSALGFPNAAGFINLGEGLTTGGGADFGDGPPGGFGPGGGGGGGDAFSLGNWFAGNVNIMSLLETDLSNINPGNL